jgi:hypothetical protein
MEKIDEVSYLKAKMEATVQHRNSRGRVVARYKAGTRIQDASGGVYVVQEDGSWRKSG